jgi:hypothetical protein
MRLQERPRVDIRVPVSPHHGQTHSHKGIVSYLQNRCDDEAFVGWSTPPLAGLQHEECANSATKRVDR